MIRKFLISLLALTLLSLPLLASAVTATVAPQPATCVKGTFSKSGNQYWWNITLTITNSCTQAVDLQNSSITFMDSSNLNTNFWGSFSPLDYPDNNLQITSQPTTGGFLASLSLHFPTSYSAQTKLAVGKSIAIKYGAATADYNASSLKVYLNQVTPPPVQVGTINLTNSTAKPTNISQAYAVVNVLSNQQTIGSIQVPWSGSQSLGNLAPGTYTLQPITLTDSQNNVFQGAANPAPVNVTANQTVNSAISYTQISSAGSVNLILGAVPAALGSYTTSPSVTLTRADTGSTVVKTIAWNQTTNIPQLASGVSYNLTTPLISANNARCTGTFSPTSLMPAATAPSATLTYNCATVTQDAVTLSVSGLSSSTASVDISLVPTDNSATVLKTIPLTNGSGSATVNLTDGVIYNASVTNVNGYTATISPQILTAKTGATLAVAYQKVVATSSRLMTYIPGWKTPPPATELATAGYTHVFIAFGVFSTTQPGQIVSAFDTVTAAYITSLHNAGIKVLLSIGGASTSLPNTTVDFHSILSQASSPATFQQNFIQSLTSMMSQYGFDGFDIDIEQGFTTGGTFSAPTGDIAVLANIINTMKANNPNILISLVPQVANISATSGFDATWGNYASLIMQTRNSLSWVGIQLYNTGCAYGIDQVCYDPNQTQSPNFGVAMAVDILESWPAKLPNGQSTGFQPYIGGLRPDQVVLGYPVANATGASDGAPATPTATIKRSIQCLRTATKSATSCDTYVPPKAYGGAGGVFNWEATYDQANNYKFATDLKACITQGSC